MRPKWVGEEFKESMVRSQGDAYALISLEVA